MGNTLSTLRYMYVSCFRMLTYLKVPGVERNGSSCACQQRACAILLQLSAECVHVHVRVCVCLLCVGRESAQRDTQVHTSKTTTANRSCNPSSHQPASSSLISPVLYRVVSLRVVRLLPGREEEDKEERLDFSDPDVGAAGGSRGHCWWRPHPPSARISRDARFG